jgi:hypothetical protein
MAGMSETGKATRTSSQELEAERARDGGHTED